MDATIDTTQGLRFPSGAAPTAADDLARRLDQLSAIGASLSAERDINRLLEAILTAAKTITRADGGTLYRVTEEKTLRFEIVRTSSLKYYLGGSTGNPVPFYPIQLYKDDRPNQRSEEHTSELQSRLHLVCRLLLEKKKKQRTYRNYES